MGHGSCRVLYRSLKVIRKLGYGVECLYYLRFSISRAGPTKWRRFRSKDKDGHAATMPPLFNCSVTDIYIQYIHIYKAGKPTLTKLGYNSAMLHASINKLTHVTLLINVFERECFWTRIQRHLFTYKLFAVLLYLTSMISSWYTIV